MSPEAAAIHTEHIFPPIPDRRFDWCAYREGYEGPDSDGIGGDLVGYGRTEAGALADLETLEEERLS